MVRLVVYSLVYSGVVVVVVVVVYLLYLLYTHYKFTITMVSLCTVTEGLG